MTRLAALGCSTLLTLLFAAPACSEDKPPPLGGGADNGGEDGGGSGGGAGRGGAPGEGGEDGGGQSEGGAQGGAASPQGGAVSGTGGGPGAGGELQGSGGQPRQPEPDLVTSSGGPWPDSLTGLCSNGVGLSGCPQQGDAFFGQDGTYRINVPAYTATSTTLSDQVTELVWQIAPPLQALTQAEAVTYCEALELGGQADWRLPTRLEYVSLLDQGKGAGYALPPAIPFDATGTFWTASASGVTPGLFFVVNDQEGTWNVVLQESPFAARCVRGEPRTGTLEAGTGVVTDTATRLTWQASELEDTPRTWEEALVYCETLSLGGKEDWRLPSVKELATLVDESATASPVIAAVFGSEAAADYWSSSPTAPFLASPAAFALDTDFGISLSRDMTETSTARCVRTAD